MPAWLRSRFRVRGEVYAGLDKARLDLSEVAFSLDGKRFFELSGYSFDDFGVVEQIVGSIKPALGPTSTPSPKQ